MSDNVTGTTPLPVSSAGSPVQCWLDVEAVAQQAQQPQSQQIANFEAKANEDCINGSTVAVNQHFVVYTVKNGLIRVLHRHSTLRTLLRAHQDERVTDIRFFQDGDVLATVGSSSNSNNNNNNNSKSTIVIWRIFERPPEVTAEILLEISSTQTHLSRVLWHPFNPNEFWMVHTNAQACTMASLVETTKIQTHPSDTGNNNSNHQHAICDFFRPFCIMQNVTTVQSTRLPEASHLTDLAWSPRDCRHLLTCHSSGEIILWDLKVLSPNGNGDGNGEENQTVSPQPLEVVLHSEPVSRCLFLPHDDQMNMNRTGGAAASMPPLTSCFVTASARNSVITLWSPFFGGGGAPGNNNNANTNDAQQLLKPTRIQVLSVERPSPSYILDLVYGVTPPDASPLSSFLIMADRHAGNILAFHLKAQWEETMADDDNNNPTSPGGPIMRMKRTLLVGADYVVPFQTRYPVYSWSVQCAPTTDITEEELVDQGGLIFDTKLFSYQSKLVQCLTLTSYMCLPPETTWVDPTFAVRVERLYSVESAHVSVIDDDEGEEEGDVVVVPPAAAAAAAAPDGNAVAGLQIQYDEDYDYKEDDEDEDGAEGGGAVPSDDGAPDPPSSDLSGNPFANWLGAIAAKSNEEAAGVAGPPVPPLPPIMTSNTTTSTTAVAPPPTIPTPPAASTATTPGGGSASKNSTYAVPVVTAPPASDLPAPEGEPLAFLSPSDFVSQTGPLAVAAAATPLPEKRPDPSPEKQKVPKGEKKRNKQRQQQQQQQPTDGTGITLLRREGNTPVKRSPPRSRQRGGDNKSPPRTSTNRGGAATAASAPPAGSNTAAAAATVVSAASPAAVTAPPPPPPLPDIAQEIRQAVKEEMKHSVIPAMKSTIKESLSTAVIRPLQASMEELTKPGAVSVDHDQIAASFASSVDPPLRMAFADSMKTVFIPTLESITGQILETLSENLAQSTAAAEAATNANGSNAAKELAAMSSQLSTMTELVAELTREVQSLRDSHNRALQQVPSSGSGAGSHVGGVVQPPPVVNTVESMKADIRRLLAEKNFEAAFTKAVSASTAELAVFCCAHADVTEVLAMPKIQLSQPIILCLMQQLGTVVATGRSTLAVELEWLQDLALSLDPRDAQIQQHVPRVLQQLVASITQRMSVADVNLRRPLQRLLSILRGIPLS